MRELESPDGYMIETKTMLCSPFSHTWAECFISRLGWIPVDFVGQAFGKRVIRPLNVVDGELRRELAEDTQCFDEYYFGNLDPFRIHTTSQANKQHVLPTVKGAKSITSRDALDTMTHRLICRSKKVEVN